MNFEVTERDAGLRLDLFLHAKLPQYSRSRLQQWAREQLALVNGRAQRSSHVLRTGDAVVFSPGALPVLHAFAEDLPIEVLYQDDDVIAVNKPAGMVVHAGSGNHSGTLVNAVLHHFGTLSNVSGEDRPGIVHRIDRETSGVILVARTDFAHRSIAGQFAAREVEKVYLALVQGVAGPSQGKIELPIARDPVRRIRMTTSTGQGRSAVTWWRVIERLPHHTLVEVRIGTGRTHQIRVHMSSAGHPVAGDILYGAKAAGHGRFFLHAHRLVFTSPSGGQRITIESPLAPELVEWLRLLR